MTTIRGTEEGPMATRWQSRDVAITLPSDTVRTMWDRARRFFDVTEGERVDARRGAAPATWPVSGPTRRLDVSTASKSAPRTRRSSGLRTSLFQAPSDVPDTYQFEPLSARTRP